MKEKPNQRKQSILLVDDHELVRQGLAALLQRLRHVEVIGEAGSGKEALEQMRQKAPDIILMDLAMEGMNGLLAAAQIKREYPETKIMILSMHADESYVLEAFRAGAVGYLLKSNAMQDLEAGLEAISQDETYLSPAISTQVLKDHLKQGTVPPGPFDALTERQREILQLVAQGKNTKEIAFLLNISTKTVEAHRAQGMARLGLHDVPSLVHLAMKHRLLSREG
ncbi:MAG: response regulator transcription factor [Verrucomicrobiota bacterium]|nr:response regulator transcription factor [Verrucomicrobiota bacterium]